MSTLTMIGHRQKSLLKSLLHSQVGLTIDELSKTLEISRNAVKQHLVSLKGNGFIENSTMSSTGGRPSKVYTLTDEGKELFPRHYDLFTNLLMRLLQEKLGEDTLKDYLDDLGTQLASEFRSQMRDKDNLADKVNELTSIMYELGYEAKAEQGQDGLYEIIASNCVFHKLANENNMVCNLDLALISAMLEDADVEHKECMVKGGHCCRFAVSAKS